MENIKASDIIGRKVMDARVGKDVAVVSDIIYDPSSGNVFAFLTDDKGWFAGASVVYLDDIESIGEDRILLKSELAMHEAADEKKKLAGITDTAKGLHKTSVISEGGNKLGFIADFTFDTASGQIESFDIVHQETGKLQKNISVGTEDILTFGEDGVIVKNTVEERMS